MGVHGCAPYYYMHTNVNYGPMTIYQLPHIPGIKTKINDVIALHPASNKTHIQLELGQVIYVAPNSNSWQKCGQRGATQHERNGCNDDIVHVDNMPTHTCIRDEY